MAQCSAIKANGARCQVAALPGQAVCWGHDPTKAEARRAIARKGGRAGGVSRTADELRTIKTLLQRLIEQVEAGTVERAVAITINLLLNSQLRVIELERKLKEVEDLEARIAALEAATPGRSTRWA